MKVNELKHRKLEREKDILGSMQTKELRKQETILSGISSATVKKPRRHHSSDLASNRNQRKF